jgi:prevent-host-death family protein
MMISASDFKARCLALIDQVREGGEPIVITKRGKVVARLVAAGDEQPRPWAGVKGAARLVGNPFAPAIDETEIESLK